MDNCIRSDAGCRRDADHNPAMRLQTRATGSELQRVPIPSAQGPVNLVDCRRHRFGSSVEAEHLLFRGIELRVGENSLVAKGSELLDLLCVRSGTPSWRRRSTSGRGALFRIR